MEKTGASAKESATIVYRTLVDTIKVPEKDDFQVSTEHDSQNLIYDPSYLDIPRTDGIILPVGVASSSRLERSDEGHLSL